VQTAKRLEMPQSSSKPWFGPELFFKIWAESRTEPAVQSKVRRQENIVELIQMRSNKFEPMEIVIYLVCTKHPLLEVYNQIFQTNL